MSMQISESAGPGEMPAPARDAALSSSSDAEAPASGVFLPSAEIMVHIAFRGDVWFSDGEWAGSDNLDRAIEGFVVKPGSGVDPSDVGPAASPPTGRGRRRFRAASIAARAERGRRSAD